MSAENQPTKNKATNEGLDLEFALHAAGIGVWELDPVTNALAWDDRCRALFGLNADQRQLTSYADAIQYIHPEDKARVENAVKLATVFFKGIGFSGHA